jgi:phage FluMu protein gp41
MNIPLVESLIQVILSLPAEERLFLNEKLTSYEPTTYQSSTVTQSEEHVLQALIALGRIQPPLHCQDIPSISEAELREMTQNLKIFGKLLSETVIEDRGDRTS